MDFNNFLQNMHEQHLLDIYLEYFCVGWEWFYV